MRPLFIIVLLAVAIAFAGPVYAEKPVAFVSIPPQKYFVEKIGDKLVDVRVMVTQGQNPHSYEPRPSQMAAVAKAKAYFAIGVPFEKTWLPKFAALNPAMVVIRTDNGVQKIAMVEHHPDLQEGEGHESGHMLEKAESEHGHAGLDPHIWTSPVRVRQIAQNILSGLVKIDPGHEAEYQRGYSDFLRELDALDAELRKTLQNHQGQAFMVYHPSWGYLAHDYGLVQKPIEIEGKAPKPAQLAAVIDLARRLGAKVIFVQPQMSSRDAEVIAREIGGQVIKADPLAENWAANLKEQAAKFGAALR